MADDLAVNEETITALRGRHDTVVDETNGVAEPPNGEFGYGGQYVAGIIGRGSMFIGKTLHHNDAASAMLQYVWDTFQDDDGEAALMFDGTV